MAALATGARVGVYEIASLLGIGGMGEVYRARDTKLGRDVAIKILPSLVAGDPDRLARFEREARLLASLNHPHIAQIYGVEESSGVTALVLELVEGETLAARITARPKGRALQMDESVAIARQIADALDAAHERGIVHRDLKPANIVITPDGTVKVLDFGLATERSASLSGERHVESLTHSPTVMGPTMAGVLLGTAPYMSPEQARGKAVDKRTDIWAFGCVLYEILTGRRAFPGETTTDSVAAILEREPDWSALPSSTPSHVQRLLRRCLEKDPKRRLRDIGDARVDLDAGGMTIVDSRVSAASRPTAISIAALTTLAAVLAGFLIRGRVTREPPRGEPPPSALTRVTFDDGYTVDPAISRDGALIAFASDRAGRDDLDVWVQQTAGGKPIRVTTDDVDEREPSFSPDGTRMAFRSERGDGAIYVTPTFGGEQPRLLVAGGRRPTFSPDGRLLAYWTGSNIGFSGVYDAWVVPLAGGAPQQINGLAAARFPVWSPDGRSLIVLASQSRGSRNVSDWDWWIARVGGTPPVRTGAYERLVRSGVGITFPDIGPSAWDGTRVLFSDRQFLWAIDVDSRTGESSSVRRITFGTGRDSAPVASDAGAVAFMSTTSSNNVWSIPLDANRGIVTGPPRPLTEGGGFYTRPSASRDGRLLAYHARFPRESVFLKDLTTGGVTDMGVAGSNFGPAMSPDGTLVAYELGDDVVVSPTRGGAARTLCRSCQIGDWTADGRALAVQARAQRSPIALVSVADLRVRDLIVSDRNLSRPHFSSDDRFVAFRVTTDGQTELMMVARMPAADKTIAESEWVQIGDGERDIRPCGWAPGKTVLYFLSSRDGSRCLYAQPIDHTTGRPVGAPIAVRHSHGGRNAWVGQSGVLSTGPGNAIRSGSFLYDLPSLSGSIWTLAAPSRQP